MLSSVQLIEIFYENSVLQTVSETFMKFEDVKSFKHFS